MTFKQLHKDVNFTNAYVMHMLVISKNCMAVGTELIFIGFWWQTIYFLWWQYIENVMSSKHHQNSSSPCTYLDNQPFHGARIGKVPYCCNHLKVILACYVNPRYLKACSHQCSGVQLPTAWHRRSHVSVGQPGAHIVPVNQLISHLVYWRYVGPERHLFHYCWLSHGESRVTLICDAATYWDAAGVVDQCGRRRSHDLTVSPVTRWPTWETPCSCTRSAPTSAWPSASSSTGRTAATAPTAAPAPSQISSRWSVGNILPVSVRAGCECPLSHWLGSIIKYKEHSAWRDSL